MCVREKYAVFILSTQYTRLRWTDIQYVNNLFSCFSNLHSVKHPCVFLQIRLFLFSLSCGTVRYLIRTFSKKMFQILRAYFSGRRRRNLENKTKLVPHWTCVKGWERKKERKNAPSCFGKNRFGLGEVLVWYQQREDNGTEGERDKQDGRDRVQSNFEQTQQTTN